MRTFFSSFKKYDWIFLAVIGVTFFLLIQQYIPALEDFHYRFKRPIRPNWEIVTSFNEAVQSQCEDYYTTNGRVVIHTFVQWFCGQDNPVGFFLLSTFAFVLLIMGMLYLIRKRGNAYLFEVPLLFILLLLLTPDIGTSYLGHIAFVVNYLWSSALYVWFIIAFLKVEKNVDSLSLSVKICLALFALVCGL